MTLDAMLLRRLVELLPRFSYRFADEIGLHEGIAQVLSNAGIAFEREHVGGPQDRFDFLIPVGIVIEVKTKGSLSEALRQIARYAARPDVAAVILVTTRFWGAGCLPAAIHGKPIHMVKLRGGAF